MDDDSDGEDAVKKILVDESGFWKPLVEALKVSATRLVGGLGGGLASLPHQCRRSDYHPMYQPLKNRATDAGSSV